MLTDGGMKGNSMDEKKMPSVERDQEAWNKIGLINAEFTALNRELEQKNALLKRLNQELKSEVASRKEAEEALRRSAEELQISEAKFRQLIKVLPLPVTLFNKAGEHSFINDRFVQVFEYAPSDIVTLADWQKLAFPDEKYRRRVSKTRKAAIERASNNGLDIDPIECNITCKSGTVRVVRVSGIIIGDEVLSTFTDMTEQRRQEQAQKTFYERRRISDLMNELVRGNLPTKKVVQESARIMGAKIMGPFSCFHIAIDDYRQKPIAYWREEQLTEYRLLLESVLDALEDPDWISWESPEGIGVMCFELSASLTIKKEQKNLAELIHNIIANKVPETNISIGISELADNMVGIGTYYRQAISAVSTGSKVWPQSKTYHYSDMGVYQVLSCFNDEEQITAYIERTLGKLLNYDKRKSAAYLDTLEIILMSDNLKEGAGKLSIHYHTLMFRKQRCEAILGVSLDDFSSRMAILTAIHLLKLRK